MPLDIEEDYSLTICSVLELATIINIEYTWISLKVVEFRSLYYILYHSLCDIKWNFLIVIVTISLDDIMDNRDEYIYLPGHAPINPN